MVVAHTFNPSTWESHAFNPSTTEEESRKDMAGWRDEYKAGGDRSSRHSVWGFMETGSCPLWSEDSVEVKGLSSGWLLYFSDLSAFTPISDSGFLLLRPIRIHATFDPMTLRVRVSRSTDRLPWWKKWGMYTGVKTREKSIHWNTMVEIFLEMGALGD